ncbi:hypothetical protein H5410_050294 [Solanum commersonii]|uniref:F-box domain-containing protein n=1 Tax=Solanum commersonii TaxID=4109 RepID=A0A9J5WV16_SOLCO|nr:hypothetical protein H5410_050294 [Solanum commersonii]
MADSYFLPELLREILLKLPAKSLLRFTAVCESWHSVITSFPFISAHLAQTPHSDTLIVRRYVSTSNREHYSLFQDSKNQPFYLNFTSELNFPFNIQLGYFRIIGSCNGILCLADDLFGELRSLILWNPSIQNCLQIMAFPHHQFSFISAHLAQTPHSNTLLVRRYIDTCNKENYLLFQDSKNQPFSLDFISELNFPFKCQRGYYTIVGSYNGIVCLSGKLFGKLRSLVLWNPSIQKFITLPFPSIKPKSPHMSVLGFGADLPETNDYKLVRLVYRKNDVFGHNGFPEIEIYSINSGVWRRVVGFGIKHCIVEVMSSQAFVKGFVHWIVYDFVVNGGGLRVLIMTFNIADEVFGEIMLPDALTGGIATGLSLMLFEESLVVVKYGRGMYGVSMKLYRINLVANLKKVVGFRNNGEVLILTRENGLVSYDPNSGRNTGLGIQGYTWSFYV